MRRDLHWLPIRNRIVFKLLLITYKIRHGRAPAYLTELVKDYIPACTLRSTAQNLFELKSNREIATVCYGERALSVSAPSLWNKLPLHIRNANSVNSFKHQFKTYLFNNPSDKCNSVACSNCTVRTCCFY